MSKIFLEIMPLFLIFILGYFLRKTGVLKKQEGDLLLKLIFYVSLPALIIISITRVELSREFVFIPFIAMWVILITFFVSFFVSGWFSMPKQTLGVFLIGSMIIEVSFVLPFIIAAYGNEGLARIALFDLGNSLLAFTFIYFIACQNGDKNKNSMMIKKLIFAPPIWAIIIAVTLNLTELQIPEVANGFFEMSGSLTVPLVMLSLGIYFNPKVTKFLPLSTAIFIRMFIGLLAGFVLVNIFDLEGLTRSVVLVASAAPICYNTLTFSSLEKLDKEFASNLTSFSLLIGFITTPVLIYLVS